MDHFRGRCKRNVRAERLSVWGSRHLSAKKPGPAAVCIQDTQAGGGNTGRIYGGDTGAAFIT